MTTTDTKGTKRASISVKNKTGQEITSFSVRPGSNIWVFLRKHKLPIGAACSGVGVCGACAVTISPTVSSANENSSPVVSKATEFERTSLQKQGLDATNQRLACLCRVYEDITVEAPYW